MPQNPPPPSDDIDHDLFITSLILVPSAELQRPAEHLPARERRGRRDEEQPSARDEEAAGGGVGAAERRLDRSVGGSTPPLALHLASRWNQVTNSLD